MQIRIGREKNTIKGLGFAGNTLPFTLLEREGGAFSANRGVFGTFLTYIDDFVISPKVEKSLVQKVLFTQRRYRFVP